MNKTYHIPALLKQSIEFLNPFPGKTIIDATLGGGGHSKEILKKLDGKGLLICIDQDLEAIKNAKPELEKINSNFKLIQDNFSNINKIIDRKIDGILFDLGVSSHQINDEKRGFSLRSDGPIDMRMDQKSGISAKDIVNSYDSHSIAKVIKEFGEEKNAGRIAKRIVEHRDKKEISTTLELASIIKEAVSKIPPKAQFDCVTRTFQALRISVNDELNKLSKALESSLDLLNNNGRIVVISYHSLEDRIVKNFFRKQANPCICPKSAPICICSKKSRIKILTKKPIIPDEYEINQNPRARSAKLRSAEIISS